MITIPFFNLRSNLLLCMFYYVAYSGVSSMEIFKCGPKIWGKSDILKINILVILLLYLYMSIFSKQPVRPNLFSLMRPTSNFKFDTPALTAMPNTWNRFESVFVFGLFCFDTRLTPPPSNARWTRTADKCHLRSDVC